MKNRLFSKSPKALISGFLLIFSFLIQAQNQQESFGSKIHLGGGLLLSFGNGFFSGTLAPSAI